MERHDEKDLTKQPEKGYESPKLVRVSLRPEEAVLGHCKVTGSTGPVAAGCNAATCRVPGS